MKIELKLHSNPISTNSAYYKRNNSFNETSRKWRANFFSQLQSDFNQLQIKRLYKHFTPDKHMLKVCFTWHQPIDVILTKAGTLSLRSMDVDNCLKIPTDCVFDAKYNDKWLSLRKATEQKLYKDFKTLSNLNINDKYIFDTRSIKMPSVDGDFHCSITIETVPLFHRP